MTITIRPASTVMFTGDSITDLQRPHDEDPYACSYPVRVAGEWSLRHPDRPVTWLNTAVAGHKVMDLEARWQADVLDARPDVLSILVGVNDLGWHTLDPDGHVIPADEFKAGYGRLLAPLADAGTQLILIEPFLLPIQGVVEAGAALVGEREREQWREDLDPKIQAVHELAGEYGAHLIPADRMFAELSVTTGPEFWAEDGVHPTSAGHSVLATAWLDLVA
ncbi:SGNH/GDSL hydrolase family protein [Kibdelosporangium phytohabitans]|uniref:GDSL family lipase n=1 Tax=Kibdelosporangium phytohabitans TaxID=860235 RepID=A0A0N9I4K8_9PSEU|nr:SGNH/GDSL hydrolase family protein [Kibdelosporangium phytohabitans]ALG10560.1 GDSL family lipase [Kibdelosporangium phytohabitans]MBE1461664.1 lysophospholipase L1-like esterase [Kibdelosporangium phytohabitans]